MRDAGNIDTRVVRPAVISGEVTATENGTSGAQAAGIRPTSGSALAPVRPLPSSAQAALPSSIVALGELSVPVTPGRSVRPAEYTGIGDLDALAGLEVAVVVAVRVGVAQHRRIGVERVPRRAEVLAGDVSAVPVVVASKPMPRARKASQTSGKWSFGASGRGAHRERLLDDGVARIDHRRVVGGHPHATRDQCQRRVATDQAAEIPQPLRPQLAAVVRAGEVLFFMSPYVYPPRTTVAVPLRLQSVAPAGATGQSMACCGSRGTRRRGCRPQLGGRGRVDVGALLDERSTA